ncbi:MULTISPECIES: response regulator [Crocosphaera]|uniref:Two-component system, regulatory protein n=5 Tax=Crocosphaera watsonii TaxID=263511 RepID=T2JY16_CROWT|nr:MULTISPECIES: response regulator [Crocosphaera]EHJ14580.1 two-component system, regulatory protein [Crocosphaera watsonii WH 0003]MCH2246538.1 response regulator [Crocosphaera sp.]NQZ64671.1 response regulator [Crocosphaera sp.]CCQ52843.1 two-component system, regulatory protein [Crocosphaera watsonii WH 8502]CCQ58575.1 two-component system, regulatory protein [Crocosphaera watsonii WH 0005]
MATVLIVEDDPINLRVFSKILTKRGGLSVKGTEDVDEVMRIARQGEVDIILMDVSLSHSVYQGEAVDGIKITQFLKADPTTANLPIILVTAHAMEGDREHFLEKSGADGYISKPVVDHEKFVNKVLTTISNYQKN